jgi:hypothetical protein
MGYGETMKKTLFALITIVIGMLVAVPLQAGVKVTTAPDPVEKLVAFRTAEGKYVTTATGGFLNLSGEKIGSKQKFTIVDLNGTDPADGDPVKIRYTPGGGDVAKSTYWVETADGIKRNSAGSVFKIKLVDGKYAFQPPSGKFVTGTITADGMFSLADKQASALLLEIVDLSGGVPKTPKKSAAQAPAASAPAAPAPAAPVPEKPATE